MYDARQESVTIHWFSYKFWWRAVYTDSSPPHEKTPNLVSSGRRVWTVLKDLGTAPPYILGTVISFLVAFSSDQNKERRFHIALPLCFATARFIVTVATLNVPARYLHTSCTSVAASEAMPLSTPGLRRLSTKHRRSELWQHLESSLLPT
jgi:hypothetical protein